MAIVRGVDGTFYEVPDDQLAHFKIPEDKLKEKLGSQAPTEGAPPQEGPPHEGGGAPTSPLVNVAIYYAGQGGMSTPPPGGGAPAGSSTEGAVQPYDWRNWRNWRNWYNWYNWRNWRNHWD